MNHLKINPIGKDFRISRLQKKLYDKLSVLWGVDLFGYPRCYKIERDKKTTIEYYIENKEYLSLVSSEKNKFFFTSENEVVRERDLDNIHFKTTAELYFIVNLKLCKPSILHRADEEVVNDVMNIITKNSELTIDKVITGVSNVFRGIEYNKVIDYQPYHCFRIDLTINNFKINEKC